MDVPIDAIPPRVAAVTMAVVRGARDVRTVADVCEFASLGETLENLREAREMGLVGFADHQVGTLHAKLVVVASSMVDIRRERET